MSLENENTQLKMVIRKLLNLVVFLLLVLMVMAYLVFKYIPEHWFDLPVTAPTLEMQVAPEEVKTDFWKAPSQVDMQAASNAVELNYGKELIVHTATFFGPQGKVKAGATNGMNCQNCHLNAGTQVFGNNYSAVAATYPKYRARSGKKETVFKRINDCFERSLNGQPLDSNSREMKAMAAYILWLGNAVPGGKAPAGSGLHDLPFLDRAADPVLGEKVYKASCSSCHQQEGQGMKMANAQEYVYPPLWGPNSYNIGAGLYRLSNFARFVKYNMPLGVTHDHPQLTDEEAWDVAAYVNSQPRPSKELIKDWPKLEEKPFDHPFGPFSDSYTAQEHKYGPFGPIKNKIKK